MPSGPTAAVAGAPSLTPHQQAALDQARALQEQAEKLLQAHALEGERAKLETELQQLEALIPTGTNPALDAKTVQIIADTRAALDVLNQHIINLIS